MEKKYLFFDIDGTLTNRATGGIVPSAKEALQRLEENGHFVAIATGRAHQMCIRDSYYAIIRGGVLKDIPTVLVEHAFVDDDSDFENYLSSDAKLKACLLYTSFGQRGIPVCFSQEQ